MKKLGLTKRYWSLVISEAAKSAWGTFEMKSALIALFVTVLGAVLVFVLLHLSILPADWEGFLRAAIENAQMQILYWITTGVLALISFFFFVIYAPAKIHKKQDEIIAERVPEQLTLKIEHGSDMFTFEEKSIKVASLNVTNEEKQKIIELQALLNFHHFQWRPDRDLVSGALYSVKTPLYFWIENDLQDKIELRPEIPKRLFVCELGKFKYEDSDEDFFSAMFGGKSVITARMFDDESIYRITIMFQGKLEGEHDFRATFHKETIYVKPSEQIVRFIDLGKEYPEVPNKLLDRAKRSVDYFESERKQLRDRGENG